MSQKSSFVSASAWLERAFEPKAVFMSWFVLSSGSSVCKQAPLARDVWVCVSLFHLFCVSLDVAGIECEIYRGRARALTMLSYL